MMRRLLFMSVCLAFSAALAGIAVFDFSGLKPAPLTGESAVFVAGDGLALLKFEISGVGVGETVPDENPTP